MQLEQRAIRELKKYDKNPRINKKAIKRVADSIEKHGQVKPVVLSAVGHPFTGEVICAGHTTIKAMLTLGYDEVYVVVHPFESERAFVDYNIRDNKSAEFSEWNDDLLGDLGEEFNIDLGEMGFDIPGLDDGPGGNTDPDAVPDPDLSRCASGQIWEMGDHRLLCGDSTDPIQVARLMDGNKADLMFTDPPYGVSYADKNKFLNGKDRGNCVQREIKNDHMSLEETGNLWAAVFSVWAGWFAEYSSYYIASPQIGGLLLLMMDTMNENGFPLRHCLIWVKNNHVLGRCDYNYKHEPILYGWCNKHKWYGGGSQNKSTLEFNKPLKNDLHPTMKPVDLIENLILNSSAKGQLVIDPFLGSGSTLIAAESTGRICRGMELDPHYCSVILKRWEDFTGKTARLLG